MYEILKKKKLAPEIFELVIKAPFIASHRKPGQFVIVRIMEDGERIPLTIADADEKEGSITLVIQAVGKTTRMLSSMEVGEFIKDVAGPLGKPTEIEKCGTALCIAGGIGIAPLFPIIKGLKAAGNRVIVIIGARTKELIVMEDKVNEVADRLVITTDDGSYGMKGLVTDAAEQIISEEQIDKSVIIGPPIMMKFSVGVTKKHGIPSIVSLNPIMVDGTGMCGGCRVTVGGETKFACVDGPEFEGDLVDFDELLKRLSMYKKDERQLSEKKESDHKCRIGLSGGK